MAGSNSDPIPAEAPKLRRWRLLVGLAWVAVAGGTAQVLIALVWRDSLEDAGGALLMAHFVAFMCQTFVFHAGIAMAPVIVLAIMLRRRRLLVVSCAVLLAGAGPELASVGPVLRVTHRSPLLKIMSANLLYSECDMNALAEQIKREAPDVIVFQEWTSAGSAALKVRLLGQYPQVFEQPRDDAFGQAVFSRRSFVGVVRAYPPLEGFHEPQISFAVDVGGRPMRITNVHVVPPIGPANFGEQRRMARQYATWLADNSRDDRPDVLVGDFNATSRSSYMATIRGRTYRDGHGEAGWWRGSTWPRTGWLAWGPGLQIDHVLVGPQVYCWRCRCGSDDGSDHRPVIVDVGWQPR